MFLTSVHSYGKPLNRIARLDPSPKLLPGNHVGSKNEEDYTFGVTEGQLEDYTRHADLFHRLFIFRYSASKLTPYMMKMIDVVPILLRDLPFNSIMRCSTEGQNIFITCKCVSSTNTLREEVVRPTPTLSWRCSNGLTAICSLA